MQPFAITVNELLDHALGGAIPSPLQFAKQYPGNSGVLGDKCYMGHEHGFKGGKRRGRSLHGLIRSAQQSCGHPFHYRLNDCILVEKMTKQGALG